MSKIKIRVYQNHNRNSKSYKKYFGRVQHSSTVDSTTLCLHAAMDSGIESTAIAQVYDAQQKQMKEQLFNGHTIVIPELGTFKIGVASEGLSVADVQERYPQFDPETEDIRKYLSARQVKKAYLLFTPCAAIKEALRAIKFETDKVEWTAQMQQEKTNV